MCLIIKYIALHCLLSAIYATIVFFVQPLIQPLNPLPQPPLAPSLIEIFYRENNILNPLQSLYHYISFFDRQGYSIATMDPKPLHGEIILYASMDAAGTWRIAVKIWVF